MRSVGSSSYPIKAFLDKDEARAYKVAQEEIDTKARYFIDTVDLVGL